MESTAPSPRESSADPDLTDPAFHAMRADVFLHHVRIFKTRGLSTQACTKGNVKLAGAVIKPARELKAGDLLEVERGEMKFVLRVVDLPVRRVGAPLVGNFMENLTPPENYLRAAAARRERELTAPHEGPAKPDKRQLRMIREWLGRERDA
jgi:ribosome-associated heat shock protein Hsp15